MNNISVSRHDITDITIGNASPAIVDIIDALGKARLKHAAPMHSPHEGYAILLEEVDEVKAEVWMSFHDKAKLRKELTHVAAMAIRMIEDLDL